MRTNNLFLFHTYVFQQKKKINSYTEFYIQDCRGQMSHTIKIIANCRTEMNQSQFCSATCTELTKFMDFS